MITRADAVALDRADPLAGYREEFVIPDPSLVYLDGNSLGRTPKAALTCLTAVAEGGDIESAAFEAAAGALDKNSVALSESIASVYGEEAGEAFLPLWRKHIGFFVDYTLGVATDDQAKADKAKEDLNAYRTDFGAFIEGANPNLPAEAAD